MRPWASATSTSSTLVDILDASDLAVPKWYHARRLRPAADSARRTTSPWRGHGLGVAGAGPSGALVKPVLSGVFRRSRAVVTGFNCLDRLCQRPSQDAPAEDRQHGPERPSLEVLSLPYHDYIHLGRPVRLPREGVGVARVASPRVGVGGRHDHAIG